VKIRRLLIASCVSVGLALPAVAAPQDLTTQLSIFLQNLFAGRIVIPVQTTFAALPSATNGTIVYCSDCTEGQDPATGGGSGAFVLRQNGRWLSLDGGGGSGGGAPTDAEYVVAEAHASLSAEVAPSAANQVPVSSSSTAAAWGTVPIAAGGTGQTAKTDAFDALSPLTTAGDLLTHDGSDNIRLALGAHGTAAISLSGALTYRAITFMGGVVSSAQNMTSTSYADVPGLTTTLPANQLYQFRCYGTWVSTSTLNGMGLSVNGTGGTGQTAVYTLGIQTTAMATTGNNTMSTTPFSWRNETNFDSMTATATAVSALSSLVWQLEGFYFTGTSGNSTFAVRVRTENGSPDLIQIGAGSFCLFTRQTV
jgi:hypothetical protein